MKTKVSMRSALSSLLVIFIIMGGMTVIIELIGGVIRLRELVNQAGPGAPLVFVSLKAATFVVAPLSGTPLKVVAGTFFGLWHGTLYILLGDIVGGSINFWLSRLFGRTIITKFVGNNNMVQIDNLILKLGGWRILLLARIFLSPIYDFVSYASGLTIISYSHYAVVSILGGVVPILFWVAFGASLAENRAVFIFVSIGFTLLLIITIGLQNRIWQALLRILKVPDEIDENNRKKNNE